jgi:hypothetical protein
MPWLLALSGRSWHAGHQSFSIAVAFDGRQDGPAAEKWLIGQLGADDRANAREEAIFSLHYEFHFLTERYSCIRLKELVRLIPAADVGHLEPVLP